MYGFRLDPRTRLLLLFIMGIAVFSYMPALIIGIYIFIGFTLLLICKKYKSVGIYIIIYFLVRSIGYFVYNYDFLLLNSIKGMTSLFTLFFPLFVYGKYFILTTSVSEFSLALEKMKTPLGIQIISLVMLRFFPTVRMEFRSVFNAMRLRGVSLSPLGFIRHPVKTVEYLYVPLVYSLIKTGDELTVASLSRGLGLYKNRTYLAEIGFTFRDLLVIFLYLGLLLLGTMIKGGII